ncbi:MAG TPA: hypothetical protein DEB63_10040 [Agrobacterium sp.]|nr:hypothetical protein CFBP6626_08050 [Agrobacterium tumefaciens]QCM10389.1 hypothetical protein CFBP6625_08545 [Agrobacterium tumefaciens]HBT68507.1 hypothetical protein [Agrobacterium sp.]HCD85601.1 hypothetical protein [Agrobacterium sp.]
MAFTLRGLRRGSDYSSGWSKNATAILASAIWPRRHHENALICSFPVQKALVIMGTEACARR